MTETSFRGPLVSLGATIGTNPTQPSDGPSVAYQGVGFLDPRLNNPAAKDSNSPGALPGYMIGNVVQTIDNIPSAATTTVIAAAQVATSGTAFSLATTAVAGSVAGTPSWTPGVPIIPRGTTVATTAAAALDFGFTTGTTALNSSTVVVVDSTMFTAGQWIGIGGVGNSAKTVALLTQVVSISNATTILVSPVAAAQLDNAPIGQANLFNTNLPPGTQFGPSSSSASAVTPYRVAGAALMFDPLQAVTRNITVTAATIGGGTATVLVSGWDIYGEAMTELLTADGTTTVNGKKAFKYISSVVAQANGSATFSIGVGHMVGLPLRSDRFGVLDRVTLGNNVMATAAGYTAAVTTAANNTSGDVRGALVLNTLGGAVGTTNGTSRLSVMQVVPLLSMLNGVPTNATSLFGVAQA